MRSLISFAAIKKWADWLLTIDRRLYSLLPSPMMNTKLFLAGCAFAALAALPQPSFASGPLLPDTLRCEYRVDPLGIDETSPRLSWRVASSRRDERQSAYQILVASTDKKLGHDTGDLWDSGRVATDDSIAIVYAGRVLSSRQVCHWKVRVWDKDGKASAWSQPALWSMGLLEGWTGAWIGYDERPDQLALPAPFDTAHWIWFAGDPFPNVPKCTRVFMSSLQLPDDADIDHAELLVAVNGRVSFNINGTPAQISHSSDAHIARLVDVTPDLKAGANILRAQVENTATGPAGLIARLTVKTRAGATYTIVTDDSWRATDNAGANWHNRPIGPTEWPAAQVIGPAGCEPWGALTYSQLELPPPAYLRTEFKISQPVQRATLYATALGIVDLHLNGHLVSEDRFTPGWTDYNKRVHYRTYDVTQLLHRGANALGAILADGWYSGYIGWGQERDHYGKKTRFRGQLEIEYGDGSKDIIATSPEWKASNGPIQEADFLMGEKYDARLADQWDEPAFDDSKWTPVATGAEMEPLIQAHPGPPVRAFALLKPKSLTQAAPGIYVFDLGQNFAGVARLKISGNPGQRIRLRFAERLNPDGTIYTTNLRGARATDTYICRGDGVETWEPRFTYHGFQYVEVTGLTTPPDLDTITGVALSSATTDAGLFSCSDPMLNRLAQNVYWTQRANFIDVPTDCPQRDERLGWMGDAQVYIRTATLNEDVQAFFTKWLVDVQDGQRSDGQFPMVAPLKVAGDDGGPAWADAGVICPWTIYEVYGDKRILEKHYASMARFIDFCQNRSTPDMLPPADFHCFGDWLNIKDETSNRVICTAYFAYSTKLMARTAEVLGKSEDAAKYHELFDKIKAAFNRAYVGDDGRIEGDTQTDYVLALSFGLLDSARRQLAALHLVEDIQKRDWHLSTGFVGTKNLMLTLADIGCNDVASRLIHNDTFPSWGFSIKQGATSIWERWDGWTPEKGFQDAGMNSFAHYSFGAVYQWMVENIGGIRSDDPDYKHILIDPRADAGLGSADVRYVSIHGPIESHWTREGGKQTLSVIIPANTSATIFVPATRSQKVLEGRKPAATAPGVRFLRREDRAAVFAVGSGIYHFVVN
jgi:alpha-L-rhamnosidase